MNYPRLLLCWIGDFWRGYQRVADGRDRVRELLATDEDPLASPADLHGVIMRASSAVDICDGIRMNLQEPGAIGLGARVALPWTEYHVLRREAEEKAMPAYYVATREPVEA
jgi:hypothetical protein